MYDRRIDQLGNFMTLQQVIQQNYQGQTDTAILTDLASTVTLTPGDSSFWNYTRVVNWPNGGLTIAEELGAAIQAAGMVMAAQLYATSQGNAGIQLSDPNIQAAFTTLLGVLNGQTPKNTSLITAVTQLQAMGQPTTGPKWQSFALSAMPTQAQVDEGLHEIAILNAHTNWMNNTWNALVSSGTATAAQLQSSVASLNTTIQGT